MTDETKPETMEISGLKEEEQGDKQLSMDIKEEEAAAAAAVAAMGAKDEEETTTTTTTTTTTKAADHSANKENENNKSRADVGDTSEAAFDDAVASAAKKGSPIDVEGSSADDNDDDSDSTSTTTTTDDDMDIPDLDDGADKDSKKKKKERKDPNEILAEALTMKEDGNKYFKEGDLSKASRSYRKGTSCLKKLNEGNTGDEQVKSLLISLQTNLSMVCFKQDKHKMSRDVATNALQVDANNVKALYRRAVASRKMGKHDEAKVDLKKALSVEPSNNAIKKELHSLTKKIKEENQKHKESMKLAFGKKGSLGSLYQDKEEEQRLKAIKKAEEEKRKKEEEAERLKKRKIEWEDECVKRLSNNEEAISYEDWDKEREEKEKKEKEERNKKKQKERKEREERRKKELEEKKQQRKEQKEDIVNDDSDHELTESELKALRGYKKTSDGRTTSYFTKELSEHEKQMIGDITPQRLDATATATTAAAATTANSPQPINHQSTTSPSSLSAKTTTKESSVWNQAGTWEERDTTEWCRKHLEKLLTESTIAVLSSSSSSSSSEDGVDPKNSNDDTNNNNSNLVGKIMKVKDLTGDASVAMTRGKKRYIFDFHLSVEYNIYYEGRTNTDDDDNILASGTIKLPDISSASVHDPNDELDVEILRYEKSPSSSSNKEKCTSCRKLLIDAIKVSVNTFVNDFNKHY